MTASAPTAPRALRVGLTGGLASGKSTVASALAAAGCTVIDADRLVAELYRPGASGARAVRDLFGPSALDREGGVDHRAVAKRVFADADSRRRLEEAIHPLVRRRFEEIARATVSDKASGAIVVLEATLLVEAGYAPSFDLIVTVEAPEQLRLARATARGLAREDAQARLEAQGDGARRRQASHRILDNDGGLDHLEKQIAELVLDLRALEGR